MPVTSTRASLVGLLTAARSRGGAVGAFNVVLLEHAEAIVAGATAAGAPVVAQISQNCVEYHGSIDPLVDAVLAMAAAARVPVVVHLDHVTDPALVERGVLLGVDSVMFDASVLPYAENVARTREVVQGCHAAGVAVEAELGEVGGKDGVHAPGARTDPAEAAAFVNATGVDALAVAVGTSHAMLTRSASIDLGLVARLAQVVPVPLVLHGSSGVPDATLRQAVAAGISKVNVSTLLNALFTGAVRRALDADAALVDPRRYVGQGRTAVSDEVARLLVLLGRR